MKNSHSSAASAVQLPSQLPARHPQPPAQSAKSQPARLQSKAATVARRTAAQDSFKATRSCAKRSAKRAALMHARGTKTMVSPEESCHPMFSARSSTGVIPLKLRKCSWVCSLQSPDSEGCWTGAPKHHTIAQNNLWKNVNSVRWASVFI